MFPKETAKTQLRCPNQKCKSFDIRRESFVNDKGGKQTMNYCGACGTTLDDKGAIKEGPKNEGKDGAPAA